MVEHEGLSDQELWKSIRRKALVLGGNSNLKIYGTLACKSGKRLKRANRVFFSSEVEAKFHGYRPCGHCLKEEYKKWIYSAKHQISTRIGCPTGAR